MNVVAVVEIVRRAASADFYDAAALVVVGVAFGDCAGTVAQAARLYRVADAVAVCTRHLPCSKFTQQCINCASKEEANESC